MTIDEAKKVAAIAATADGGCDSCVKSLFTQLNESFPVFEWRWEDSYWKDGKVYVPEVITVVERQKEHVHG